MPKNFKSPFLEAVVYRLLGSESPELVSKLRYLLEQKETKKVFLPGIHTKKEFRYTGVQGYGLELKNEEYFLCPQNFLEWDDCRKVVSKTFNHVLEQIKKKLLHEEQEEYCIVQIRLPDLLAFLDHDLLVKKNGVIARTCFNEPFFSTCDMEEGQKYSFAYAFDFQENRFQVLNVKTSKKLFMKHKQLSSLVTESIARKLNEVVKITFGSISEAETFYKKYQPGLKKHCGIELQIFSDVSGIPGSQKRTLHAVCA